MSGRGRLALSAWAATLLASGALLPLVEPVGWLVQAALLLSVQSAAGAATRRLGWARALTVAVQLLVTLVALVLVFVRDQALFGAVPGPQALRALGELLTTGTEDVGRYAIPAPMTDGIRLLLVGGVLVIGLAVDALAVTFRSAAPAGLPLLALYSVAAGLSDGGAKWLWFLLAAAGYLLLLLAESRDRVTRWGRVFGGSGVPGRTPPAEGRTARVRTGHRIGVVALGVALVVPAGLPALDGGLLSGLGNGSGGGGGSGGASAVKPLVALQDNLNQPENREVLSYSTNAGDPLGFYLRILSLDRFTGSEWLSSRDEPEDLPDRFPQPAGLGPDVAVTEVTANVSASRSYRQEYLPMPYPATEVRVDGRWRYQEETGVVVGTDGQTTSGARYEVGSLLVEPTAAQLRAAPPPPDDLRRAYTQVPRSLPEVVARTARDVTQGAADPYERAVRLQDWFAHDGGFTYDTTVNSGSGTAAISRFLKDKQGFCVHFSFAMAAMARTLGIPARVAVGFTPGALQTDGTVSVGLKDAHAWPELYFEGVGWTRFEPTPTRGTVPSYTVPDAPSGQEAAPAAPSASASALPSAAPSASESCAAAQRKENECGTARAPAAAGQGGSGAPPATVALTGAGVALLVLLLLGPVLWRTRVRTRRLHSSEGRAPSDTVARTLSAWREITDTAWDHGIPPADALTPRKAAARVVRLGGLAPEPAAALHRVAGAVEQALYAASPRPPSGLAQDAAAVRAGLREQASRGARIRATLLPRSAVRVVWALTERRASVVRRLAEKGSRVADTVRPRRPFRRGA
ncbi:DUF3488 and transglutaminase-like domain-containing protein [uncultured Streptomyces sp.]|uniref:transglutaminase TgpA family protein n=1 Tax=uncultured Streptomyces sp. TaxID=174707 RepID=UPI00261D2FE2|nr:DUF3488 and transglutaminase-like domain-containing protein [uncultured Streptomyces sp.]